MARWLILERSGYRKINVVTRETTRKKDGVTERLHLFSIQGKPEGLRSTVFLKALDVFFL
jgi:hypothetical protein